MDLKGISLSMVFGAFIFTTCMIGYWIGSAIGNLASNIKYKTY